MQIGSQDHSDQSWIGMATKRSILWVGSHYCIGLNTLRYIYLFCCVPPRWIFHVKSGDKPINPHTWKARDILIFLQRLYLPWNQQEWLFWEGSNVERGGSIYTIYKSSGFKSYRGLPRVVPMALQLSCLHQCVCQCQWVPIRQVTLPRNLFAYPQVGNPYTSWSPLW